MKFLQSPRAEFIPARPSGWFTRAVQELIRAELNFKDHLKLRQTDLEVLKNLPSGCGVILASNHADEADPRVCLELARQSHKPFITMCNREAFDELGGIAGWALQRLGYFSVKRGAKDLSAKEYAIEVVRKGKDVLVVFPEGEIFYQNEKLQHFHPGVVDICLKAICENRKIDPNFTAFVVPMVIKYHYSRSIEAQLDKRISRMENDLSIEPSQKKFQQRLLEIAAKIIERKHIAHELSTLHAPGSLNELKSSNEDMSANEHAKTIERASGNEHISANEHTGVGSSEPSERELHPEPAAPECYQQDLSMKIRLTQNAIFQKVEHRHNQESSGRLPIISRSWKLGAEIRHKAAQGLKDSRSKEDLHRDLLDLQEVEHLSAWSPRYLRAATSSDRLAESVMKMERELYNIKRPKTIPGRDVFVKIAQPIDMGQYASNYEQDARAATSQVTQLLQTKIQDMLDEVAKEVAQEATG